MRRGFAKKFLLLEFPPLDKNLRKRKREEEKEERQRNFFSRKENSLFVMAGEKPTENEQNSTEDDEDESPSVKFRRGEYVFHYLCRRCWGLEALVIFTVNSSL